MLVACEANDLGIFCVYEGIDSSSSPDCESGICLKQEGYGCEDGSDSCVEDPDSQTKTSSYCTQRCRQSGDCLGGESDANGCSGYVCQQRPAVVDDLGCLCVCLDFIRDASGVALTRAAFEASEQACR